MFKLILLINSLSCFTIMVNSFCFSFPKIMSAMLSTILIRPIIIHIFVCFIVKNVTSCRSSRHSITYINKLCQSYGKFKQTSQSFDTVKHNVVLVIFRSSPFGRACILFQGLSTSVGVPGANSFFPNDISIAPPTKTYSPPSCQLTFRYSYGARCCLGDR